MWFWTVHWNWRPCHQRHILQWWQASGWVEGWRSIEKNTAPFSFPRQPDWSALKRFLADTALQRKTQEPFPWVTCVDPCFPEPLRSVDHMPTVLWSNRAWEPWKNRPVLTVVGSRNASHYGQLAVQTLVPNFAQYCGALVVSGGARGIDQAAHQAALSVEQETWAVLGCGLAHGSRALPAFFQPPARLISPFPPDDPPAKWRFPARNQIMAQLGDATLIVEAAQRSGSLITASAALEANKEVMVVLPPFTSPNSAGAMHLLQQGATPVATWQDILRVFGLDGDGLTSLHHTQRMHLRGKEEEGIVSFLKKLGGQARWKDIITMLTQQKNMPEKKALSVLTSLELRGVLQVELGVVRLSGMIQS